LEALQAFTTAGIRISIVTNQSCVGRGVVSQEAVDRIHQALLVEASRSGASIAKILVCPHAPNDGCRCRKPLPGLVIDAVQESNGIPRSHTLLIGDAERDLEAGRAAGIAVALVLTGKGRTTQSGVGAETPVFKNLLEASRAIIESSASSGIEGESPC
jgi:D-glycero-D-manno-heptose 1,7-bisphosphate phosphatase